MRLFHRELGSRTDNAKWLSREGRRYKGSGFTSDRVVTIGIPTRAGGAGRKKKRVINMPEDGSHRLKKLATLTETLIHLQNC
jgi:hypothetical protein